MRIRLLFFSVQPQGSSGAGDRPALRLSDITFSSRHLLSAGNSRTAGVAKPAVNGINSDIADIGKKAAAGNIMRAQDMR